METIAEFRDVMAAVCSPVVVATSIHAGRPHGTTVSAFTSLSLSPPLVTVALNRRSNLLRMLRKTRKLGINILGRHQEQVAKAFAHEGADRFSSVSWTEDRGLPCIDDSAGWVVCDVTQLIRGGDHVIAIGCVTHATRTSTPPLIYHDRLFGTWSPNGPT